MKTLPILLCAILFVGCSKKEEPTHKAVNNPGYTRLDDIPADGITGVLRGGSPTLLTNSPTFSNKLNEASK